MEVEHDGESTPEGMHSDSEGDTMGFESPRAGLRQRSVADVQMMPGLERRVASLMNVSQVLKSKKRNDHHSHQQQIEEEKDREEKREWRWTKALEELVDTERKYIASLKVTKDVFVLPLQQSVEKHGSSGKALLDPKLVQTIFSDIDIFLKLHEEQFLPGLEKESREGGLGVGKFFIARASFLKMYTSYINKYEESSALLQKEEIDNAPFKAFLQQCYQKDVVGKLKLNDFLIRPLHRLTRYALLLRELDKNCKKELTRVKLDLQTAIGKVSAVTSLVNDRVRDAENRRKVVSISEELQNLIPNLIQPARRYVSDCAFFHYTNGAAGTVINVFIFNDLIVTAMKTKEFFKQSYQVKQFEVASMLLQLDIAPATSTLHAMRFYDKDLTTLELCTESFDTHMEVVQTLVRHGVVVEGAPYPRKAKLLGFPEKRVVLIGDKECGKASFLRTIRSTNQETYMASATGGARERMAFSGELYEPFTVPFALQTSPQNVTLMDTYSDEHTNADHKEHNRELWERADLILHFVNLEKDYRTDYWKSELDTASYAKGPRPPVIVVNCHETKEPQITDPAAEAVVRTLSAVLQLSCATSNKYTVRHVITSCLAHLAKTAPPVKRPSLSVFGVGLG